VDCKSLAVRGLVVGWRGFNSAATGAALSSEADSIDSDLGAVITAWPKLSQAVRDSILAQIRQA
jgi:hypothetical protein